MPLLTTLLLCVTPGSETAAPTTDLALNLRLASSTTHVPLSPQWAMSYYQAPPLIAAPAPVDSPTKQPIDELPLDIMPFDVEPTAADGSELNLWHDWTMSDLSLEWGLATIGPGVLAPQYGAVSGRPGGGGPGGGGGQQEPNGPTFLFPPPSTPGPLPGPGPNVEPVPEPGAVVVWLTVLVLAVVAMNRRGRSLPRA